MSTQAWKCPNMENGGKVNVQVSIKTVTVKYGAKFNVLWNIGEDTMVLKTLMGDKWKDYVAYTIPLRINQRMMLLTPLH